MTADAPLKVMHVITGLHTGGAERMLERLVLARRERPIAFRVVALVPGGAVFENLTKAGQVMEQRLKIFAVNGQDIHLIDRSNAGVARRVAQ